jgi:hypothetical protein
LPYVFNTLIGNEVVLYQNSIPGTPYDKAVGYVTSVTDTGSGATAGVAITTTLPYANVAAAAWWSGAFGFKRMPNVSVYGSSGCDAIIQLQETTRRGMRPGELFVAMLFGRSKQSLGQGPLSTGGIMTSLTVNVLRSANNVGNDALKGSTFNAYTVPAISSPVAYNISIDLTVAGKRVFTQTALTGAVGNDGVSLNSVAQSSLPNVFCPIGANGLNWSVNYAPSSYAENVLPWVEFEAIFDYGMTGRRILSSVFAGNNQGQIPS